MCGDEKTEREVRRRTQAGANAWRAVEGVMADRRISKKIKDKVMSTCVTPVSRVRSSPVPGVVAYGE